MKTSTLINHDVRLKLGLSCNEFCVADFISSGEHITRQQLADRLGLSKQSVIKIINKLVELEIVNKNEKGRLCISEKWMKSFNQVYGKEFLPKTPIFNYWQPVQPFRKRNTNKLRRILPRPG